MSSKIKITFMGAFQIALLLAGLVPILFFFQSPDKVAADLGILALMILLLFMGLLGGWLSMLINAIKNSRVGWAMALFFLAPFSYWIYFVFVYIPHSGHYIKSQ